MSDDGESLMDLLSWAMSGPLVRWPDGLWRGLGAQLGDDDFTHEEITALVNLGVLEFTSVGAILKQPPPSFSDAGSMK